MSDLVTWLRAQLDDDERVALAASPAPWHLNVEGDEVLAIDDVPVAEAFALSGNQLRATAVHIARWDPTRVLAEVEAKRRILADFECWQPHDAGHEALALAVQLLALPYADREGYDEAWRP